jgi:hypothetical protein
MINLIFNKSRFDWFDDVAVSGARNWTGLTSAASLKNTPVNKPAVVTVPNMVCVTLKIELEGGQFRSCSANSQQLKLIIRG